MSDVRGQSEAIAGVERALAAGRGILLQGPPGVGATMIARRIPGLLPRPTEREERWIAAEYEAAWLPSWVPEPGGRPFRAPHHTCFVAALCGSECLQRAGELQLARFGVLFLDDLPEFRLHAIERLAALLRHMGDRAPLVVASAQLCPCGGKGQRVCVCLDTSVSRYRRRVADAAGPLQLETVPIKISMSGRAMRNGPRGETSAEIRQRLWGPFSST